MRRLTLIRHAKSSWNDIGLDDFDRPLNPRGLRSAPRMGGVLQKEQVMFDLMVSSPALRAITTAQLIADKLATQLQIYAKMHQFHECTNWNPIRC
jgi:phosphohistidine phosphatase